MKKIEQVIVVEGRHDTENLKKYYDCETIETHGTCLSEFTIRLIQRAQKARGVIVFTDPDSPGNRIRHAVNEAVPGCLNAYIDKELAKTAHKVGVEHAGQQALEDALSHLVKERPDQEEELTMQDLYELGLSGRENSSQLREQVGRALYLGNGNARTMCSRLNSLGITKEKLQEVLNG